MDIARNAPAPSREELELAHSVAALWSPKAREIAWSLASVTRAPATTYAALVSLAIDARRWGNRRRGP